MAMTIAQAEAEAEKWRLDNAFQSMQRIELNGYDVNDRDQRHARFRENNRRTLERSRQLPDAVAIEVVRSPNEPCDHPCIGLWDINDCPEVPPRDCPNEICLCHPYAVFRDKLRGRFIAGWSTNDQ